MKCFYHLQADGGGLCKNCQRALCKDCAGDPAGGLACPNRCEKAVAQTAKLVATNIRITSSRSFTVFLTPAFFIFAGLALAYYAYARAAPSVFYFLGAFNFLF